MRVRRRELGIGLGIVVSALLLGSLSYAHDFTRQITVSTRPLQYIFDGEVKTPPADQAGFTYNNTIYVPLRFVAEALGKKVGWDAATGTVALTSPRQRAADRVNVEISQLLFELGDGQVYAADYWGGHHYWDGKELHPDVWTICHLVEVAAGRYEVSDSLRPGAPDVINVVPFAEMKDHWIEEERASSLEIFMKDVNGNQVYWNDRGTDWQGAGYHAAPWPMSEVFERFGIERVTYRFDPIEKSLTFVMPEAQPPHKHLQPVSVEELRFELAGKLYTHSSMARSANWDGEQIYPDIWDICLLLEVLAGRYELSTSTIDMRPSSVAAVFHRIDDETSYWEFVIKNDTNGKTIRWTDRDTWWQGSGFFASPWPMDAVFDMLGITGVSYRWEPIRGVLTFVIPDPPEPLKAEQ